MNDPHQLADSPIIRRIKARHEAEALDALPSPPEILTRCRLFGTRCLVAWVVIAVLVFWLSGHNFERSPALGWLVAIILGGALPVRILSAALAEYNWRLDRRINPKP